MDIWKRLRSRFAPILCLVLLAAVATSCQHPRVAPEQEPVAVRARTTGTVAEIRARPGTPVLHGAWVATLFPPAPLPDPAVLRKSLQERETELATARTRYLKTKQRVELGETVPEEELLSAHQAFLAARNARNEARAFLETTQQNVETLRHYAPCSGTVVQLSAPVGRRVNAEDPILFIQPQP